MKRNIKEIIDGKQINIYADDTFEAPIIYANMHEEIGNEIIAECEKLECPPFHLVSITGLDWDAEMSPWKCGQIVSKNDNFTGDADKYMQLLSGKIIPQAEQMIMTEYNKNQSKNLPDGVTRNSDNKDDFTLKNQNFIFKRYIAGYSMGGLFALYAPYISDVFSGVISVSGSVWFPDFVSYVKSNYFIKNPASIYLSIGDKESRTKNKYLCTTQDNLSELNKFYIDTGIPSVFELNPGNHFSDVAYRMAKGITRSLMHTL